MRRHKMRFGLLATLLVAVVACGEESTGTDDPTAPDEQMVDDPGESDPSSSSDSEPSDETDPDPVESDPTAPDDPDPSDSDLSDPDLSETFCLPEPVREDRQELTNLWDLFKGARDAGCYLESYEESAGPDGPWQVGEPLPVAESEWSCDEDNRCRQYRGQLILGWETKADLGWSLRSDLALGTLQIWQVDKNGESFWDVEVEYMRNGSTATYRLERTYDSSGKIHLERSYFQVTLRQETFNTFELGRLVRQETVEQLGNGNATTRTRTWAYDDAGRMLESTYQRLNSFLYVTTFDYDSEGRVIASERTQDGVRFLDQSWNYEGGRLQSRASVMEGEIFYDGSDTFVPAVRDGYSSHWDDSGVRKGRGGCEQVPTSLWHGYPESDQVYILGWKRNDVPNSIGFGYGYDGFGFNYGDLSWMGHGGIATSYESARMMSPSRVQAVITYDEKGRMVEETVESESDWGESVPSAVIVRSRVFDGDNMTEDDVRVESNSDEMLDFESQTLSFVYDSAGQLVERTAQTNGVTSNHCTWTYDEEGRVHEHAIYGVFWNSAEDTSEDLPLNGAFRDMYSVDGPTVQRSREKKDLQSGDWVVQRTTTVTQTDMGSVEQDNYFSNYRVRNVLGTLTEVGYGSVDEPSSYLRVERDSMNQVSSSGQLGTGGMGAVHRRYTYQCTEE